MILPKKGDKLYLVLILHDVQKNEESRISSMEANIEIGVFLKRPPNATKNNTGHSCFVITSNLQKIIKIKN